MKNERKNSKHMDIGCPALRTGDGGGLKIEIYMHVYATRDPVDQW